jgi:hypothetical protein
VTSVAIITAGLIFWICAWALGIKSFDAFLVTALAAVVAASLHLFGPLVRQALGREHPPA